MITFPSLVILIPFSLGHCILIASVDLRVF